MEDNKLIAFYGAGLEEKGKKTIQSLALKAVPGESIFLYGNAGRRQVHFEVLAGQRQPDSGDIILNGDSIYECLDIPSLRREKIGIIPRNGGLIPEITMLEQIVLPMKLSGWPMERITERVKEITGGHLPLHDLYNKPVRCSQRKQAIAAILRALVMEPKVLMINGYLDDFEELDSEILWNIISRYRSPENILVYFSGAPASDQIAWTQQIKL